MNAEQQQQQQLAGWWRETAESEIDQTVAKAIEYGATDLLDLGHSLARMAGRELEDSEAAELGVLFYLRGKVARWEAAVTEGRQVSDDTLLDIGIYVRMAQRIRQAGSWPGVQADNSDSNKMPGSPGYPPYHLNRTVEDNF